MRRTTRRPGSEGMAIATVLLLLVVFTALIPIMIMFTNYEAKWSVKSKKAMSAFQLAEAAVERGYLELTISTNNWATIQAGTPIPGFNFDNRYTDIGGGDYTISITSGSSQGSAVVIGIGRDSNQKETRAIQVIYAESVYGNTAIETNNGVDISGANFNIEWGSVITPKAIVTNGRAHPQFWSANNVDLDTNGPTPPNCDTPNCCQWHSYDNNLPPMPQIELSGYKTAAQGAGSGPCGPYYSAAAMNLASACTDTSGNTYYSESDINFGHPNNYIVGNVIALGNLSFPNGHWGVGSETLPLPTQAWKQYCNDWNYYLTTFDSGAPASWPGMTSSYVSPSTTTYSVGNVMIHGFTYVGGNVNAAGGGGDGSFVGVVYAAGTANLGASSHATIYFDSGVANSIHTSNISLSRQSWQEVLYAFPSGI